jgi:hypothetical protein
VPKILAVEQKFQLIIQSSVQSTDFGTRSKVLIMVLLAFKTFDLVPKSVPTTLNTRSKVFIML